MKIEMHAQDVSDAFWRNLSLRWAPAIRHWTPHLDNDSLVAEQFRVQADYNTGSIPSATAIALLILGNELKPDVTFEVGTFIGNTTRALALTSKHVYTCDGSNDIRFSPSIPNVTYYPKTVSTAALEQFAKLGKLIDLLVLDGRIQPGDTPHLKALLRPEAVIALDDCYQLEKGVVNVGMLNEIFPERRLFYVPPPRGEPFAAFGVPGGTTLGLVVPATMLGITQG